MLSNICRDPSCDERVHPECRSRPWTLQADCVASLNARRLWQRHQSVHDGFRVFSDFLLENHVAISRRYPLISHTHTMVLSVPEDEKQQACVVLLSREWRIQPVSGGGCSTMLGASVYITLFMHGWRPV